MVHVPVAERRARLLTAAWTVMSTRGLAAATTRAICAEAGMPQSAFHYCFTSRNELLREVATGLLPDEIGAVTATVSHDGTLVDTFTQALMAYWELVERNPGAHLVLYEITTHVLRDPHRRDIAQQQYERYLQGAEEVLATIAAVRGIAWRRPIRVLARQVVTMLDGLTLHYAVDADAAAARQALAAFAADLAALAVTPEPSPVGSASTARSTGLPRTRLTCGSDGQGQQ